MHVGIPGRWCPAAASVPSLAAPAVQPGAGMGERGTIWAGVRLLCCTPTAVQLLVPEVQQRSRTAVQHGGSMPVEARLLYCFMALGLEPRAFTLSDMSNPF